MMRATKVDTDVIRDAVRLACRAPSLYNSQPWRWVAEDGRLDLVLDRERMITHDRSGREALIGCGAALDHLRVAMAAAGWQAHIERFPDPQDADHLASAHFTRAGEVTEADRRAADAILARRSDRLPFYPPGNWASVEPLLRDAGNATVRVETIPDSVRPQLADAAELAESLRLYDSSYHTELDGWTVPFETSVEGVPRSSLVSAAEGSRVDVGRAFPFVHHRDRRADIPKDGAKVVVLSTETDSRMDALVSGEVLSQVLLRATAAGLATCPLTHVTELEATRAMVAALLDPDALDHDALDHDAWPQVLVRVGVAPSGEQTPPATPRRPLDDVLRWVS